MEPSVFLEQFTRDPLMIEPSMARVAVSHLQAMLATEDYGKLVMAASSDSDFWDTESWTAEYRPYVVKDGILQVPIVGVLLNKFPYAFSPFATGYEYIEAAIARGLEDPEVKGIALMIHSPGGVVAGNFELADYIYGVRSEKPIMAFANDYAFSAAYSLASSAATISTNRSGSVGSIGVVTMHVNQEKFLENTGFEVTFIFAGKHKVDGNPYEGLSPEVRDRIQARVDKLYDTFTFTVARNRGIENKKVRDTEALTYDAEEAISIGLVDRVGPFKDELAYFVTNSSGENTMEKKPNETTADAGIPVEQHQEAVKAARIEGHAEGVKSERTRIVAILDLPESKDRAQASFAVALKSDMSVEAAQAFLASLPTEKKDEPGKMSGSHFEKAMNEGNPEVGASGDTEKQGGDEDAAKAVLRDYASATGRAA
jgi:signal peptide peptidase SppA